ncbi:tape measure protein [Allorhizobium sp. BGMRC 0089]|uniref:tape measure protein n=1 Tax=Allorhizobium sonneratiae TaxID=2934936 RepID=UPI0020335196|nr:tape measure protein [Allorhizobium sonneratiae]MCM2291095.1 tape measure protein [Allorhizobium sonneratiae]
MRFAMIFEGIDRATKVMNKIMAAEKATAAASAANAQKATAATQAATTATAKQRTATGRASSALVAMGSAARGGYRTVVSGANAAARATAALHRATVNLASSGIGQIGSGGKKAFRGFALAAAIGAAGATTAFGASATAATQLVGVASQFEKFQTILETTEGSSAKARTAMNWVADFAAKTPYELSEVTDSFVKMRAYGLDPTKGLLKSLGDTSAAMGKPLTQAVEAMADAVTGENERLKEFGVTASKTGNKITYSYTNAAGKQMKASVKASDRMAIQTKLMAIFNEKYGGAMEKLSATWEGMMSNIADIWSQFQLAIMNAGLFDWMKGKLKLLLDTLNQMKDSGTFDAWAKQISDNILFVLQNAWKFAQQVWQAFQTLSSYLSAASDYVGGWKNLAAILAGLAFAPALVSTAVGLVQIAIGLSMLSAALMANPIVLIVAAIVAAAVAIYVYWQPIKAFFVGVWDAIAKGAKAAWAAVTSWLGFDPLAMLSSGWQFLSATIAAAWDALPPLTWDNVITALDWISWISPLRWLDFIPGFSWAGIISGALDWGQYIVSLDWTKYLPAFSWPELPSFHWPQIPVLELPSLPDIAGWIGAFGDKAIGAIEALSSRLGTAWAKVKSAFSFGEAKADIAVTDPATIQAAANATADLKADMQAVAAIDTGPAMERLQALDKAAKSILPAITAAVRQAQTFLGNVSFYNQGAALMDTMAAGIRARASVAVAEIAKVAQMMRDHLPSSPAKIGPLSDIHRLKFGETIAESIRPAPMVKAMRAAALATMGAAAITAPALAGPDVSPSTVAATTAASQTQAEAARAQIASAALQASPQAASTNAAPVTLQFSPTIKWDGQTPPATMKTEFDKLMRDSARKLADLMEEEQRRRNRRNV